ncbi:MAG TPA: hypothetical protein VMS31_04660 [Pyrinomonadaceae bacterium]|nr:hypothetical protein [Pyrinomonadaceae bacterium]
MPLGLEAQSGTTVAKTAVPDPKAEAIIARAIEVSGGNSYLSVTTVIGRGFYTPFQDKQPQTPTRFLDYLVFPDRERTEFTSSGIRTIQTNTGETGWVYDGATKTLTDMKAGQIADFKRSMRTSIENLLRGWWKKDGASLSYVGRREAGLARRNETVRLTYPDGSSIEYEFAAREGLPAKVIYKRVRTKADSDQTEEVTEEDHLAKPITMGGITAAWVVDHFVNGAQVSRINFESIEYNKPVAESLFTKPLNAKSVK